MLQGIPSLMAARGIASVFSPTDISGLKLWLKADALSLNDGDAVGTWTDSSGNGFDFLQSTAGSKPTYKANIQNGLPIVRFDGGDFLEATASIIPTNTSDYTILATCSAASTSAGAHNVYSTGTSGVGYSVQLRRDTAAWNHFHYTGGNISAGEAGGVVADAWNVITADWDLTNIHFYRNGTLKQTTPTIVMERASTYNSVGFDGPDGAIQFWDGDIGELIIYVPSLSSTNRGLVETYLKSRWATP